MRPLRTHPQEQRRESSFFAALHDSGDLTAFSVSWVSLIRTCSHSPFWCLEHHCVPKTLSPPCTPTLVHPHPPRALEFLACTSHFWSTPKPHWLLTIVPCPAQAGGVGGGRGRGWQSSKEETLFHLQFPWLRHIPSPSKERSTMSWNIARVLSNNSLCFWLLETARVRGCLAGVSHNTYSVIHFQERGASIVFSGPPNIYGNRVNYILKFLAWIIPSYSVPTLMATSRDTIYYPYGPNEWMSGNLTNSREGV